MAHCLVSAAEEIIDHPFPVLNKGFVRLVDYLGGDDRIVQAARVSYGNGVKSVREDSALIDYLLRNEHSSPFEQVVLTFHVKLPLFVARQWIRHRTARVNEVSGRYSIMKDEFYVPEMGDVALQSSDNKQGREPNPVEPQMATEIISRLQDGQEHAYGEYSCLIEQGIARELARINLPLSLYTEWYWQIDLHNLFHFLSLRLDHHAQKEIRAYAEVMLSITQRIAPLATASFIKYQLEGVRFSGPELGELRRLLAEKAEGIEAPSLLSSKEMERFSEKLRTGRQL